MSSKQIRLYIEGKISTLNDSPNQFKNIVVMQHISLNYIKHHREIWWQVHGQIDGKYKYWLAGKIDGKYKYKYKYRDKIDGKYKYKYKYCDKTDGKYKYR